MTNVITDAPAVTQKRCTKCSCAYPASLEYFYAEKKVKSGLAARCKTCADLMVNEYRREYPERNNLSRTTKPTNYEVPRSAKQADAQAVRRTDVLRRIEDHNAKVRANAETKAIAAEAAAIYTPMDMAELLNKDDPSPREVLLLALYGLGFDIIREHRHWQGLYEVTVHPINQQVRQQMIAKLQGAAQESGYILEPFDRAGHRIGDGQYVARFVTPDAPCAVRMREDWPMGRLNE